jgi:HK97 gp10 family phage protein
MLDVKIEGADRLEKRMRALPADVRFKGARFAGRRSAVVIQKALVSQVSRHDDPRTPENMAANAVIRFSNRYAKATGDPMFRVGFLGGARATSRDAERSRRRRAASGVQSLESLGEIQGKGAGNPGGDTWYWRLVNFGTKRFEGKEFTDKAIDISVGPATDTFAVQLGKWIDRWTVKTMGQ